MTLGSFESITWPHKKHEGDSAAIELVCLISGLIKKFQTQLHVIFIFLNKHRGLFKGFYNSSKIELFSF